MIFIFNFVTCTKGTYPFITRDFFVSTCFNSKMNTHTVNATEKDSTVWMNHRASLNVLKVNHCASRINSLNPQKLVHYTFLGKLPTYPSPKSTLHTWHLRWPVPIYMRVGYVFDSRFSEWKIQPISMIFGILNK